MVFTGEYALRYIVMDAGHLYYYKDNSRGGAMENMELKGEIELKDFSLLPTDKSQVSTFKQVQKYVSRSIIRHCKQIFETLQMHRLTSSLSPLTSYFVASKDIVVTKCWRVST